MLKVSELTGAQLDYWVARAEGIPAEQLEIREIQRSSPPEFHCVRHFKGRVGVQALDYSTDWAKAGPIIEARKICIDAGDGLYPEQKAWSAWHSDFVPMRVEEEIVGPTPLIAAMRAYVAQKYGNEVPECGN